MTRYCTVAQAKLAMQSDNSTADLTTRLFVAIGYISKRIDLLLTPVKRPRPYFAPYNEQRAFKMLPNNINSESNTFWLRQNLLSFSAVTRDGTAVASNVTAYPPLQTPYQELQFTNNSLTWYQTTSTTPPPKFVKVTGVWGYNSDYSNAWQQTATLNGSITASATTLNVQTNEGALFSEGQFIRINDEYMEVSAISTDTLTVSRAQNGTSASTHTTGDDVDIYIFESDISRVVARQAGLLIARQGAYEVATFDQVGVVQFPQDLLTELEAVVQLYQYE